MQSQYGPMYMRPPPRTRHRRSIERDEELLFEELPPLHLDTNINFNGN